MQVFSLSAQFARESAMLKLPEERRRWGLAPYLDRRTVGWPVGLLFLLSPIFHCHKIKDGGYNNITNTNKVSPTQNTPALQAIILITTLFYKALILQGKI